MHEYVRRLGQTNPPYVPGVEGCPAGEPRGSPRGCHHPTCPSTGAYPRRCKGARARGPRAPRPRPSTDPKRKGLRAARAVQRTGSRSATRNKQYVLAGCPYHLVPNIWRRNTITWKTQNLGGRISQLLAELGPRGLRDVAQRKQLATASGAAGNLLGGR